MIAETMKKDQQNLNRQNLNSNTILNSENVAENFLGFEYIAKAIDFRVIMKPN